MRRGSSGRCTGPGPSASSPSRGRPIWPTSRRGAASSIATSASSSSPPIRPDGTQSEVSLKHVVIFEVEPKAGRKQDYLDIAATLRPELEKIDGFISVERFASLTIEGKVLSLSFWRDEAAVVRWRQHALHHRAQRKAPADI